MEKDCEIIYTDKSTYKFNSKDLAKALKFCEGKPVFAIDTPWGVLSIMDRKGFEFVRDAVFDGPADDYIPDDLQAPTAEDLAAYNKMKENE